VTWWWLARLRSAPPCWARAWFQALRGPLLPRRTQVAEQGWRLLPQYQLDVASGAWEHASVAGRPLQESYPACKLCLSATTAANSSAGVAGPCAGAPQAEDSRAAPLDARGAACPAARAAMQAFAQVQAGAAEVVQQHVWRPASAALGRAAKLGRGERAALYRRQLQQAEELYLRAGAWLEGQQGALAAQQGGLFGSQAAMSAVLQRHRWWLMPDEAAQLLAGSCGGAGLEGLPQALEAAKELGDAKAGVGGRAAVVVEAHTWEDSPSGPSTPLRVSGHNMRRGSGPRESGELGGLGQQAAAVMSAAALLELQHQQQKQLLARCWAGTVSLQGCARAGVRLTLLPGTAA
jgi:hypothetical protein